MTGEGGRPLNPYPVGTPRWQGREWKRAFESWKARRRHAAGLKVWPTKCYEFWLILQELLYLLRPQTIVELGAGRSTNYMAEYVHKFGGTYLSFEQHLFYYVKVKLALVLSFLPAGVVRHAPLKGDWYDKKAVSSSLQAIGGIDMLFYDGPTTASRGQRGSSAFWEVIGPLLGKARIIIVDDIHRPAENEVALALQTKLGMVRYEVFSVCDHTRIAILLAPEAAGAVASLPEHLKKCMEPK